MNVIQGPGAGHPGAPIGEPGPSSSGGNGSGDWGARLRSVELDVREIKTDMKHMATRAWVLGGGWGRRDHCTCCSALLYALALCIRTHFLVCGPCLARDLFRLDGSRSWSRIGIT